MLKTRLNRAAPHTAVIGGCIERLRGEPEDYDSLLELIGDATYVLIGEASHGTHEFYAERAAITRRLIVERQCGAVCIEGDWPDAYRVDCFVRDHSDDSDVDGALAGFQRFPTWMWRNEVVREFVSWLRDYNDAQDEHRRVGFYGLDLYSMYASIHGVLSYLERVDPDAARRARFRYACFDHYDRDSQAYGYAAAAGDLEACHEDAVRQVIDLRARALDYVAHDGRRALDDFFSAEQNARLVRDAEQYYRSMFSGRASTWNLRDRHMADTLDAVQRHLAATGRPSRVVVWAHNSHLGDARFTAMRRRAELNLGQLARERHGQEVRIVGFTTHAGSVTAARDWDAPAMQRRVRPSLAESHERMMHDVAERYDAPGFLLRMPADGAAAPTLSVPRPQRAIGVVYHPETERLSHYYDTKLQGQFDALIHIDVTTALRALEPGAHWERGIDEPPETFPSGL